MQSAPQLMMIKCPQLGEDGAIAMWQPPRDSHAPVECTSKGGSLVIRPQPPYAR